VQTLQKDWGMGEASDILISGDSAGGLASYWHGDRFAEAFPQAFVAIVPDSGFFIGDETKPAWPAALQWIASAMNRSVHLYVRRGGQPVPHADQIAVRAG
jgi:hypothetical protein